VQSFLLVGGYLDCRIDVFIDIPVESNFGSRHLYCLLGIREKPRLLPFLRGAHQQPYVTEPSLYQCARIWWTHLDLNQGPLACEASALTGLSYASTEPPIIAPRYAPRKGSYNELRSRPRLAGAYANERLRRHIPLNYLKRRRCGARR
jgi:hypothetical protein